MAMLSLMEANHHFSEMRVCDGCGVVGTSFPAYLTEDGDWLHMIRDESWDNEALCMCGILEEMDAG